MSPFYAAGFKPRTVCILVGSWEEENCLSCAEFGSDEERWKGFGESCFQILFFHLGGAWILKQVYFHTQMAVCFFKVLEKTK